MAICLLLWATTIYMSNFHIMFLPLLAFQLFHLKSINFIFIWWLTRLNFSFFKILYIFLFSLLSSHSGSTCNTKDFSSSFNHWSFSPASFPIPTRISHLLLNNLYLFFDRFTTNILTAFLVFYFFLLSHLHLQLYHTSFHLSHLIVLTSRFLSFLTHSFGVPRTDDMKGLKLKCIGF